LATRFTKLAFVPKQCQNRLVQLDKTFQGHDCEWYQISQVTCSTFESVWKSTWSFLRRKVQL